jgi:hypothetical protein
VNTSADFARRLRLRVTTALEIILLAMEISGNNAVQILLSI